MAKTSATLTGDRFLRSIEAAGSYASMGVFSIIASPVIIPMAVAVGASVAVSKTAGLLGNALGRKPANQSTQDQTAA